MQQSKPKANRNLINIALDSAVFIVFLITTAPHLSGIAIHEWLSLAFGAAIVTHLLLHWQWIVGITKQFFRSAKGSARANYVLNVLFFLAMTIVIFSGIMISEHALPALGIDIGRDMSWRRIHGLASNACVLLLGLHLALHWSWMASMAKKYIGAPIRSLLARGGASKQAKGA